MGPLRKVCVSGASGFVGRELCRLLLERGIEVVGAVRKHSAGLFPGNKLFSQAVVGNIGPDTDWSRTLAGVDAVFHLAARVHVMRDTAHDPLAEFRRANVQTTENFARAAAESGVQRFVYVSSIKVNGEETVQGHRYSEGDVPQPRDPYGLSKWEAEQALWRIAQETGLEVVVVRPPLVYGAGVKGNFARMLAAVAKRLPLPLASVRNQRSLVYVGNLADALIACASHPAAVGQTYLVSDGEDVSTPELFRRLADEMRVHSYLFPFPAGILKLAGRMAGMSKQLDRLLGSLQIDNAKIRADINWVPPYSMQEGLKATAECFKTEHT